MSYISPRITHVISCVGYTGKPNTEACEDHKEECLMSNAVLAKECAEVCQLNRIPFCHVSSGSIYQFNGDPLDPEVNQKVFTEDDTPNFTFSDKQYSWYSGTKSLGEDWVRKACHRHYIWRLRMPFNHMPSDKNLLTKLMKFKKVWSCPNSISNIDEAVKACFESIIKGVPYGTYNVVNSGAITAKEILDVAKKQGVDLMKHEYFTSSEEFGKVTRVPHSNCILSNDKLVKAGVTMLSAQESVRLSFENWDTHTTPFF